jgi:light-regulated signal transduction histidine kinase (bacteriophytochrome)
VAYNPLREIDGSVTGIIAVLTDVTNQVQARQELERVNSELEEFAYAAGHDLQEPLRMVNIYTQLLIRESTGESAFAKECAQFVVQGVKRMDSLLRDLLTYSRTVHKEDPPFGAADLSISLRVARSILEPRIEENGARITAEELPVVRADQKQMVSVFQNLLSNSIKYCKKNVAPEIHISAKPDGDNWTVCVRDNGIGFDPQYAERIFGLFKRLHSDEYEGTGLGLAICKRIVERYGGRIWAEGRSGEGSAFCFSLPRAAEPMA